MEEQISLTPTLQSHAYDNLLHQLQYLDALEDKNDHDWSFLPEAVIDHKIDFTPRHQVTPSPTLGEPLSIKLTRDRHICLCVWWKNGEVTWVSMESLHGQNPWVILHYATNCKLSHHPNFQ